MRRLLSASSLRPGSGPATRRLLLAPSLGLLLAALASAGCRKREPSKVEIFDEAATPAETEALGSLAPPWPAPERVVLANGLLVHWLHEVDTPALHLRLILPTHDLKAAHQGAPALTVARALLLELEALSPRLAVRAELDLRVDRVELVVHGVAGETTAALAGLADVLAGDPTRALGAARQALLAELRPLDAETLAASELVAALNGGKPERERVDRAALQALDEAVLQDAWRALTDPREALLVVHTRTRLAVASLADASLADASLADATDASLAAATADLAQRWRQKVTLLPGNDGRSEPTALRRLRPGKPPGSTGKHLSKAPLAPLRRVDPPGRGRALLMIGRAIPTGNARERSLARLAQRRLQEQFDARLVVAGPWSLLTLQLPLGGGKPQPLQDLLEGTDPPKDADAPPDPLTRRLRRDLTAIRSFTRGRPTTQDLFQVAQLWLGARMVAASVAGEDWSALWSDSLDLANDDGEIAAALARDAQAMLAATPEQLVAWQQRWLDLSTSEPGWAWVLVGKDADLLGVQAFLAKGVSFDPPPAE
ncbi:MAG: hypothetical protein IPJ59_09695 [Nannocystis sp.]|nr:hypothetical protein [Nannocystis sp.]